MPAINRWPVSPPRSSNRTCRFPASGFPTEFASTTRSSPRQAHDTQFPKDQLRGKPARTQRPVLAPLAQEVPHPLLHVVVYNLIRPGDGSVAEVSLPSTQLRVETVAHLRPRTLLVGPQQIVNLAREPLDALLRWPCRHVGSRVPHRVARAERVSQKVELLLRGHAAEAREWTQARRTASRATHSSARRNPISSSWTSCCQTQRI